MKKTSTGGYGVIDLDKLQMQQPSFGFFARHLTYPDKLDFHPSLLEEAWDAGHPAYASIKRYWDSMHEFSLEQIEELYVQTFDFQKKTTLYMTYFKMEDSRERGQMLVRLKETYELFGLEIASSELSDYLPLMCEFLYAARWEGHRKEATESLSLMLAVLEDGTYHLLKELDRLDSPYSGLIRALRDTLKMCTIQEAELG